MWSVRWKKPSELSDNTATVLPTVPASYVGIERKVVSEGRQVDAAHDVGRDGRGYVACRDFTFGTDLETRSQMVTLQRPWDVDDDAGAT